MKMLFPGFILHKMERAHVAGYCIHIYLHVIHLEEILRETISIICIKETILPPTGS